MMSIEKYTLSDGQTGWLARLVKRNSSKIHEIRRFSYSEYGDLAFQKALEWIEGRYYQPVINIVGEKSSVVTVTENVLDVA